ncbi:MAG: hypothetical protein J5518_09630 [Lachnospiraceae bacterium]|nr:hypothetical protein [Lachnospiraceae bacterium]
MSNVYEYDGYSLPKFIKRETPESKAKLARALADIDALAKRHHAAAEKREQKIK